jgi:hypothetical protein
MQESCRFTASHFYPNWEMRVKTGGRLVQHARRLVFQLAEALVTREMLGGILERISRLRLAPG